MITEFNYNSIAAHGRYLMIDVGSGEAAAQILNGAPDILILKKNFKRNLRANARFWKLCSMLAAKIGIPRNEVYKQVIRDIGDNSFFAAVETGRKEEIKEAWKQRGIGWLTEEYEEKEGYTDIEFFFGCSYYNNSRMCRMIDVITEEIESGGTT